MSISDSVITTGGDGQITRLGDVARVELAAGSYSLTVTGRWNPKTVMASLPACANSAQ